jgi:hypothetical protein
MGFCYSMLVEDSGFTKKFLGVGAGLEGKRVKSLSRPYRQDEDATIPWEKRCDCTFGPG